MRPHPAPRLRLALLILGYVSVVWVLGWFIAAPPTRLARLLTAEHLNPAHALVPAIAAVILAGIPLLAAWLSRPSVIRSKHGRRFGLRPRHKVLALVLLWLVAETAVRVNDRRAGRGAAAYYGDGPSLASFHSWLQEAPTPGTLHVNAERFRGPDIAETKPAGVLRVFALGEDSTFLEQMPFEQTWPALLAERDGAGDRSGLPRVEVYNAAFRGWTSQHSLIWYLGRVQDFAPDVVLVMHGPQEVASSFWQPTRSRRPFDRAYRHQYGPLGPLVKRRHLPGPRASILDHSRVFWYARREFRLAVYDPAPARADDLSTFPPETQPPGAYPSRWCYERNLRTLATVLRLQGRRLMLLTHPTALPPGDAGSAAVAARFGRLVPYWPDQRPGAVLFAEGLTVLNDATRALARELNVPLVDLDRTMSNHPEWFADPWTFNAAGSAEAARQLAGTLAPLLRGPARTTASAPPRSPALTTDRP